MSEKQHIYKNFICPNCNTIDEFYSIDEVIPELKGKYDFYCFVCDKGCKFRDIKKVNIKIK
jgi:hypothetical protein